MSKKENYENFHNCIKKIFNYDYPLKTIDKEIVKKFLHTNFHPFFNINKNILSKIEKFLEKKPNEGALEKIQNSNNDLILLHELLQTLNKPGQKIKDSSGGREDSRINDCFEEFNFLEKLVNPNFRYLDLGCSEGKITKAVIKRLKLECYQSFACDIFNQISEKEFIFKVNTATTLPFKDNQFDFITLYQSAHHFTHPNEMLNEIYRILKPNGYILIREHDVTNEDDPIYYNIVHAFYACIYGNEMTPIDFIEKFYTKYRTILEWDTLFKNHNFISIGESHRSYNEKSHKFFTDKMNSFYRFYKKPEKV